MAAVTFSPSIAHQEYSNVKDAAPAQTLSEYVTYDPIAKEGSNFRWKLVWKVAAIATAIIFIAAATFAFIYTLEYYAAHLPIVSLAIFAILLPQSFKPFKYMWDKSAAYANEAAIDRMLIANMEKIDDSQIASQLKGLGVAPGIEAKQLKPLLARYYYCLQEQERIIERHNKIFDKDTNSYKFEINNKEIIAPEQNYTVGQVDWTNDEECTIFEKIQQLRVLKLRHEYEAALFRLKAAHILKIMQSPYDDRPFEQFFQLSPFEPAICLISKAHGDDSSTIYLKKGSREYTLGEVLNKSTTALSKEIFELPRLGFIF